MHGNKGSIDGDGAAAMRYTEARMSQISMLLIDGLEKNIVKFIPNFDDSETEPVTLPANYPNLLVNGATGIAAGYATNIPPYNLGEVIDATILMIEKPKSTIKDILKVLPGPDFPTGGILQGISGIHSAYETGKGRLVIRSRIEEEQISKGQISLVINEIPYDVNKSNLITQLEDVRIDNKVPGIDEVRDESDRSGMRIVIDFKT